MITRTLVLKMMHSTTVVFSVCSIVSDGNASTVFALAAVASFLIMAVYGAISMGME